MSRVNWDKIHRQWIMDGTHKEGKSARGLADFMADFLKDELYRDPRSVVYKITKGERKIISLELVAISQYLEEPIPGSSMQSAALPEPIAKPDEIAIAGELKVGVFFDPKIVVSSDFGTISIPKDKDFPDAKHVAYIQRDNSMKHATPRPDDINEGDIVICIEPTDQITPGEGTRVVIECVDNNGRVELSSRIMKAFKDRTEFHCVAQGLKPLVVTKNGGKKNGETVRVVAIIRRATSYL